ncbi:hypothetical protein BGX31_008673 [Mortierella sp. GBA43]|nr:hypothetical protein BGX31_008673 [Mortierella sp. GBA43]
MAPYVHSYADNYHGLRPSEYTILMNWIGSVTALPELDQYRTLPLQHTSESLESSPPSSTHSGAQEHQDSVVFNGSTDRLWKIWQDFLLTGMKPDVVLYTTLMDSLLSAKEYGRASQIWSHMHQHADQDRKDGKDDTGLLREEAMSSTKVSQPVSEMLELGVERKQDHCVSSPEPRSPHLMDRRPLAPNTQTFSVLMKTYCLNRDLRGVTRTYQRLLQATDSRDKARSSTSTAPSLVTAPSQSGLHGRANTVLLNQILKVLIDLGETNAAMEIYTEMRKSGPDGNSHDNSEGNQDSGHTQEATPVDACPLPYSIGTFVLPHSDQTEQPPPEPAPEVIVPAPVGRKVQDSATTQWSTPLHHQMFSRRSTWNRHARKSKARGSTEWLAPSSIQPNETTLKLMLNLATLKKNDELEEMVLKDMSALGLKDCGVGGCGDAAFLSRG